MWRLRRFVERGDCHEIGDQLSPCECCGNFSCGHYCGLPGNVKLGPDQRAGCRNAFSRGYRFQRGHGRDQIEGRGQQYQSGRSTEKGQKTEAEAWGTMSCGSRRVLSLVAWQVDRASLLGG